MPFKKLTPRKKRRKKHVQRLKKINTLVYSATAAKTAEEN